MNEFENYRRGTFDFDSFNSSAKQGFEERLGEPTELEASIGLISIAFNELETKISEGISKLLDVDNKTGMILTSELSFKLKLNMFSSLITNLRQTCYFNRLQGDGFKENYQREFIKALNKCEELRNKVIHSVFITRNVDGQMKNQRKKISSRAKHGLIENNRGL